MFSTSDRSCIEFNLAFVPSFNNVPNPNPCQEDYQATPNFDFDKTDHDGVTADLMHTD